MPDIALMHLRPAAFGLTFFLMLGASAPAEIRETGYETPSSMFIQIWVAPRGAAFIGP